MKLIESDIVVIGGGLTGLTLAYLFKDSNKRVHIIEARKRLGGRILTSYKESSAPIEMGATWLGSKHTQLNALLKALKIDIFQQVLGDTAIYEPISTSPHQLVTLPPNNEPSFRIKGGIATLIQRLANFISDEQIYLQQTVTSILE